MSDFVLPGRRRRLWPVFIVPALLVMAAAAWSAFWFVTASRLDATVDAWRAREAASGRIYDCANRSVAGFPFRLEVRCSGVSVALVSQTAAQAAAPTPVAVKLGEILVVAQIYDPKLLIAEFTSPATLSDRGQPWMAASWSTARSSIVGLPGVPQRVSIAFDGAAIDRIAADMQAPVASATHVELHGRIAEGSTADQPVIEAALQLDGGSIKDVHPLLAEPFDADIRALILGLTDVAPKPWPQRLREIQAAGGRIEITRSRLRQGDLIAVATGALGLTAAGNLDGELQMIVAGIEKVIPALGIDKMLEQGVPQAMLDRLAPGVKTQDVTNLFGALNRAIPGLGNVVRQNANAGVAAGINALGKEAELEGRRARSFPLRFVDGAVLLGPLKVGQIPPLF